MKHDCRLNYLETTEDEEGYLYIEWKKDFEPATDKIKIEYCPICGSKAKKSSIDHLTLFPRDDVAQDQLQHMHAIIMDNFLSSCDILVKKDLDNHSFQFCLDTIQNTLRYIKDKRK